MHSNDEIERVVEIYSDDLLRLALHHVSNWAEAQDVVQDVLLKFIKHDQPFVSSQHEKAWLYRVAINRCKDYQRHWWQAKRSSLPLTLSDEEKTSYPVLEEVRKLPFHTRNAIYLFYYEDMTTKEIAHIFNVKENTVSSWLHRGKIQLKKQMKGWWNDETL